MAAISVHQFAKCITCHAWSPDHSMVALCPNSDEVHIYRKSQDKWERVHVLQKTGAQGQTELSLYLMTGIHMFWNQEAAEWVPTLVILRLNRAALCVQWESKSSDFTSGKLAMRY
ncbi:Actin-related protein 2/3 complex subunit 1B [Vitis vinifera]|uniref:Actin-related protein 2/3 complex subunit 1B n=1 Tax=Vitis vinifera TaxID=29760 RepID=A0A438DC10_VITVI|nr:Actin-related protein 2/3 complex subunit 1B [Vitis vinifera]